MTNTANGVLDSEQGLEPESLSTRACKATKKLLIKEHLTPVAFLLSYLAGEPNFLTGRDATKHFTGSEPLGLIAGGYSAIYNVVLYAASLRDVGFTSFPDIYKKLKTFIEDSHFFDRGIRGGIEASAIVAMAVGMVFASFGTAAITYNGLSADNKSAEIVLIETIASAICNGALNASAASDALKMTLRPFPVGMAIARIRDVGDMLLLSPDVLNRRLGVNSDAALMCYLNENVISVFTDPTLFQLVDTPKAALTKLQDANATLIDLANKLYQEDDTGLSWKYMSLRYQAQSFISIGASIIALLNAGSVKEGVDLFFSVVGVDNPLAGEVMTPFAVSMRIALFVMSSLAVTQALPKIWKNLVQAFRIAVPYGMLMLSTYAVLGFGLPWTGTTFANAQLQDHPSWTGAAAYVLAISSDLLSACINGKNVLLLAEAGFSKFRDWWWPKGQQDVPVALLQIRAFEALYGYAGKLASSPYHNLTVKQDDGSIETVADVFECLDDALKPEVSSTPTTFEVVSRGICSFFGCRRRPNTLEMRTIRDDTDDSSDEESPLLPMPEPMVDEKPSSRWGLGCGIM